MRFTQPSNARGPRTCLARLLARLTQRLAPPLIRIALAFVSSLAAAAGASAQDTSAAGARLALADLIVVSDGSGVTVYAADAASGQILFYRPEAESVGSRVGYDSFKPLHKSETFRAPSALAYSDGKLLVADSRAGAVYALDLETKEEKLVIQEKKETPAAPVGLAAEPRGRLAVGFRGYLSAVVYNGRAADSSLLTAAGPFSDPARLAFDGNALMVLNRESGTLYEVATPGASVPNAQATQAAQVVQAASTVALPSKIFDGAGQVRDFAVYEGVVYFAGPRGVFAVSREELARAPGLGHRVFIDHTTREVAADRVAVTEHYLVATDDESQSLWLRPRPSTASHLQAAGEHLYWLDTVAKRIYRAPRGLPASDDAPQQQQQQQSAAPNVSRRPEVVASGAPLRDPVALTSDLAGNLYVLDASGPAVYVLRRGEGALRAAHVGAPLQRPTAIAAFGDWLYVSDAGARAIFSLNLARREVSKEYSERLTVFPDRLVYAGGNLVAVNLTRKNLSRFVVREDAPAGAAAAEAGAHRTLIRAEEIDLGDAVGELTDVALTDYVLYFLDASRERVVVLPLREGDIASFGYENRARRPRRIAADFAGLYLASADGLAITPLPPIEPATFYFEGDWTAQALVDFYSYLFKRGLLPRKLRRQDGPRPVRLETFTEQSGVMPTGYVDDFQQLFCQLNPSECNERQRRPPRARSRGERFGFPVQLAPGREVWLPDLNVTSYTARRAITLPIDTKLYRVEAFRRHAGATLGDLAKEFVAYGTPDEEVAKLLRDLNPSYKGADIMAEREGYFVIPILSARVHAAVYKRDVTDPTSELSEIAQRSNVIGTSMSRPQTAKSFDTAADSQAEASAPLVAAALRTPPVTDDRCAPIEPELLSAAMRLSHYCLPKAVLAQPVRVGVIDNIFDTSHEVFQNPNDPAKPFIKLPQLGSVRRTTGGSRPPGATGFIEDLDHGTHIAGLIAARKQSRRLAGFSPNATIYAMNTSNFKEALNLEVWRELKLFNISLGEWREGSAGSESGPLAVTDTTALKDYVIKTPRVAEQLFVIAAGNGGGEISDRGALAATGEQENVIVVGATDMADPPRRMEQSKVHGKLVGVMAPGGPVTSALFGGGYGDSAGTSQATALVTGTAAILKALKREWKPWQVKLRIIATADLWTREDNRNFVLSGLLNVERAVLDTDHAVARLAVGDVTLRGTLSDDTLTKELVVRKGAEVVKIPFASILRVARQDGAPGGVFRYTIVYYKKPEPDAWDVVDRSVHRLLDVEPNMVIQNRSFTFDAYQQDAPPVTRTLDIVDLLDFVNRFEEN